MYMLNKIFELCDHMCCPVLPLEITSDFKKAILKAIVWSRINVVDCCFHLTRVCFRQIQPLGLVTKYRNMCHISMWLRHTFDLLFLNFSEVMSCSV